MGDIADLVACLRVVGHSSSREKTCSHFNAVRCLDSDTHMHVSKTEFICCFVYPISGHTCAIRLYYHFS